MRPARLHQSPPVPLAAPDRGRVASGGPVAAMHDDLAQRLSAMSLSLADRPYQPDAFERVVTAVSRWSGYGLLVAAGMFLLWAIVPQ